MGGNLEPSERIENPAARGAVTQPSWRAVWLLFTITAAAGLFLAAAMPLFPQETYYWLYSRHPALSYFDHPPMVAWLIWLGTELLGDGALGIRLGTLCCSLVTTLAGMAMLHDLKASRRGIALWVLFSMGIPLFAAGHFYTTPDGPLVAFWMVAVLLLWKARSSGAIGWWFLAGVAAGCALLSKYTACFLGLGGMLLLLFDPQMRRQLRTPGPWLALVVAVAVFTPVVMWNLDHNWASIRFQTEDRVENRSLTLRWLPQLVGGQILVLGPFVALALIPATLWAWRAWRAGQAIGLWALALGLPIIVVFTPLSLITQVKLNWFAPAYPMLLLAAVLWLDVAEIPVRWRWLRRVGIGSLYVIGVGVLIAPVIAVVPLPFVRDTWSGWDKVAERTFACRAAMDSDKSADRQSFIFALHYQPAAQTWHAISATTGRDAMPVFLAQNTIGAPALAFDSWTDPATLLGRDAVFVQSETNPKRKSDQLANVRKFFDEVAVFEVVPTGLSEKPAEGVTLYACRGYKGPPARAAAPPVEP